MEDDLILYTAKVTSIEDERKEGRIQVRILPYFDKIKEKDLPWAVPFMMEQSSTTLCNDLPRENSTIRVLCDKYFKKFYYLPNRYFYGLFDYSKIENCLNNGKDSNNSNIDKTYENIKFRLYDDGGLEFHNNNDGTHGFIHNKGSFVLLDKNGNIVTNTDKIVIKSNNSIEGETIDYTYKSTNGFDINNGIDSLGDLLTELIQDLASLTTVGSPTTHTSPTLTAQMTSLLPRVKALMK